MNLDDMALLRKLGIIVKNVEYTHKVIPQYVQDDQPDEIEITTSGEFTIDDSCFRPMCHLIRLTDMICENKNPQVQEMYEELVTMLFLTEKNKGE